MPADRFASAGGTCRPSAVSATYLVPAAIVLFAVLVMHASFPIAIVLVPVFAVALPVFSLAAVLQSALYTLSFLDERAIR